LYRCPPQRNLRCSLQGGFKCHSGHNFHGERDAASVHGRTSYDQSPALAMDPGIVDNGMGISSGGDE